MAEPTSTQEELEVTTPAGKFKARSSDLISIMTLLVCAIIAYGGWEHVEAAKDGSKAIAEAIKETNKTNSDLVSAMRESNCLARLTPAEKAKPENIEYCRQLGKGR